jgi:hypothetical protein
VVDEPSPVGQRDELGAVPRAELDHGPADMGLGRGWGLTGALFTASLVASDASIEAALQQVQLVECVSKGGRDFSSRSTVQPLSLD